MRRWLAAAGAGLGLMLAAPAVARAHAGPPVPDPRRLEWRAPASCPSETEVRARLDRALLETSAELRVEVEVVPGADGQLHATVSISGTWGETTRVMASPTCETLADAVVLLASVSAIDASPAATTWMVPEPQRAVPTEAMSARVVVVEPSPEPAEAGPSEPELEPRVEPTGSADRITAAEPDRSRPRWRGHARAELRVGAGVLPTPDLGGALLLGVSRGWARVELGAAGWRPTEQAIAPEASIRMSLWSGEIRGCGLIPLRAIAWLEPQACAGLEVGGLEGEGRGSGLARRDRATRAWVAAVVAPALTFRPWDRVGFVLGAALVVPVRRLRYTVGGTEEVYRPQALAGRGVLGLEVRFP